MMTALCRQQTDFRSKTISFMFENYPSSSVSTESDCLTPTLYRHLSRSAKSHLMQTQKESVAISRGELFGTRQSRASS
jgi:hypothetical protein